MKKKISIDGFTLRRSGRQLGSLNTPIDKKPKKQFSGNMAHGNDNNLPNLLQPNPNIITNDEINTTEEEGRDLSRTDISETLEKINEKTDFTPKLTRRERRRIKRNAKNANKKRCSKIRRTIKWLIIICILAGIGVAGYTGIKFIIASNNIFNGNIFQAFQNQPLEQDSNGRSNFLVLGTSEDDLGHESAYLTDSMMIVSVDQTTKNAYIFSIPRDLYVNYGDECSFRGSGKINAYFYCVNNGDTAADEQDRLAKMQKFVGSIFDIDIQYSVHVNFTVVEQAIDAVGGIDVDIQGSGGNPGILDRSQDHRCNYECYYVKYDNGIHHLDGIHALYLAMARGHVDPEHPTPTYGLARSNFDREVNQQKIIIALKEKAVSSGTLNNYNKVMKLVDAFGNNLRTNIQTNEIGTLLGIASKIKPGDIHMISLVSDGSAVMGNSDLDVGGQSESIVMPLAGLYDYNEIQDFIKKTISSDPVIREAAPIVILNGSGTDGLGQSKAEELEALGYNVSSVDTAPDGTYEPVEIYQIGTDSAGTAAKLASLYGATLKTTTPPINVTGDTQFVIIYGPTAATQSQ